MKDPEHAAFRAPPETVADLLNLGLDADQSPDVPSRPEVPIQIGSYTAVHQLGRGGMGEVWRATDPTTHTMVAVKLLNAELAFDDESVHRFAIEARHMSGMSHPHIVKVLAVGEHEGRPFYVTPLYRESLASLLARRGPLPEAEILPIARALADALAYAHGVGIIHRDLKPANVLLDDGRHPYLCDFGLVRTVFNDSIINVQERTLEGTLAYMSPATAAGQAEDTRCDIYGWGAVLYEMLTGEPPYSATTSVALLAAVRAGPPRSILDVNPQASRSLAEVAEWAMARELRDRYAEMRDIVRDLDLIQKRQRPLGPRGNKRLPAQLLAIAAGVVIVAAGIGLWASIPGRKAPPATQDRPPPRIVRDEHLAQEDTDMKNMTLALAATALVVHAAVTKPSAPPATQPAIHGKLVTLVAPYPQTYSNAPTDKISLQYAVMELARQNGLGYVFNQSQKSVGDATRFWITPDIRQVPFDEALRSLLLPLGLGYEVADGSVLLVPKLVTLAAPYPQAYAGAPTDRISLQYAVTEIARQAGLGYDFAASQKNVSEAARRWVTPNIQKVPFAAAMRDLLGPLHIDYVVRGDKVILQSK